MFIGYPDNNIIHVSEEDLVPANEILNMTKEEISTIPLMEILLKLREYYSTL